MTNIIDEQTRNSTLSTFIYCKMYDVSCKVVAKILRYCEHHKDHQYFAANSYDLKLSNYSTVNLCLMIYNFLYSIYSGS